MGNIATSKPLGRPRKFDKERALELALQVFQENGYEGTSITDITKALKINRPSMYGTFGNKEALFAQVLEKYNEGPIAYLAEVLNEATSREVVRQMLMKSVDLLTSNKRTRGCLAIESSISSELEAVGIQKKIVESLNLNEDRIRIRFEKAIQEGDLPVDTDAWLLAKYVTTVHKGLSIQASNGTSKSDMIGIVEITLNSWPGK